MNVLIELFIVFFKLGAFTIGGGIAMLPLLKSELIENKKWFTPEEFVDAVAVCQSLPGVVAVNMATYVGYKKKGFRGSLVATTGVVLPSFVIILIIANFITAFQDNPYVEGAMAGLRAAALGLVAVAIIQLAPAALKNGWSLVAAVSAFVLIGIFNINTAWVILLFVVLGIASTLFAPPAMVTDPLAKAETAAAAQRKEAAADAEGTADAAPEAAPGKAPDEEGGEPK